MGTRHGLGVQGQQLVKDMTERWNAEEMLAEVRAKAQDQGWELRSRQVVAAVEVTADELQAVWHELHRQSQRLDVLERSMGGVRP